MGKNLAIYILTIPLFLSSLAQNNIRTARQKSWQSLVYRITADTAEAYIKKGEIPVDNYLQQTPFVVWEQPEEKWETIPPGNYVIVSVIDNELVARYYCKSNIQLVPVNDGRRLQFSILDTIGIPVSGTSLWLNGKKISYNPHTQTHIISRRRLDESIIKVAAGNNTSFFELTASEEFTQSRWQQWWRNLSYAKPIILLSTPVRFTKRLLSTNSTYWFNNRTRYKNIGSGYVIFNQPKYKPGDTLRLKAYLVTPKGKPYHKQINLSLGYYSKDAYINKNLTGLTPLSAGAYVYDFVLGDSLDADQSYNVYFNKKERIIISGSFKIEDYLLDEVTSYTLRSDKKEYYNNDSIVLYATAKDANGLGLMDGRASLQLITRNINDFYTEQVQIPDTLWQQEKSLLAEGETRFEIPAAALPPADIEVEAQITFRNSNNEVQQKKANFTVFKNPAAIHVKQDGAYITATYYENGIERAQKGKLDYGLDNIERSIGFPFIEKINPNTDEYNFRIENEAGKTVVSSSFSIESSQDVGFSRIMSGDTSGFSLYNPLKIPVHFSVLYGNRVVASATDSSESIVWKQRLQGGKIYTVIWNYTWAGKEQKGTNTIARLSKLMSADIKGATTVYPGQTDTININVTDFKGRPAREVNLTAVSYNSQFSNNINVPEPPYLQRFKGRRRILMDDYEQETISFGTRQPLGEHQQWRKVLGLDSMLYYRLLFPEAATQTVSYPINDFVPQVAVHAVQKGIPQEIYLLYINRELVYYNGVTDRMAYAFNAAPGYAQIGMRLKDQYIEIDSVYVQPYYKHDIVFNLEQLPPTATSWVWGDTYTFLEKRQLEQQLLRVTNYGFLWQGDRIVEMNASGSHLVGPFRNTDSIQYFKPGAFDLKFPLEPNYEYRLSPKVSRLEKKKLFNTDNPKLPLIKKTNWVLGDTIPSKPVIEYKIEEPVFLRSNEYLATRQTAEGAVSIKLPGDSSFKYAVLYSIGPDTNIIRIKSYQLNTFKHVLPGRYNLILITTSHQYLEIDNILVSTHNTTCLHIIRAIYQRNNMYIDALRLQQVKELATPIIQRAVRDTAYTPVILGEPMPKGNASVVGVVKDKEGKQPIAGATIYIKGYNTATVTNERGYFKLSDIKAGDYTLVASTVGYSTKALQVKLTANTVNEQNIELTMQEQHLEEVIVTAFGSSRRKASLSYSVVTVREQLIPSLQGKAAGIQVTGAAGGSSDIMIRGTSSLNYNTKPVYVINGILVDELPENIDMTNAQTTVLKGDVATSLYGSRAANGVIVINTAGFIPASLRENFRDYATWQPNLFTDKNGKASFVITYPDNITSWQTFVVGMDARKRITKNSTIVKSYKPMLAQLATPRFLIEGDSAMVIGKLVNYTDNTATITGRLTINKNTVRLFTETLKQKQAITQQLPVQAYNDTMLLQYNMDMTNGYADGELRKIPVYKKGTMEAKGLFATLSSDSIISFMPDPGAGNIVVHIQNNTIDVLLDELKQLKSYPYYCMEQTASKLTGLLLEKQIRQQLQQPFTGEKEIQALLTKLQKAQLFEGGWGWWQGTTVNLAITNYVTNALSQLKDDPLVQTNLRNATLYLQNQLHTLQEEDLLETLFTLSEAGVIMDYSRYLQRIRFDSLTIQQQWQVIGIKQLQKMEHHKELKVAMSKKIETMLGGLHWGINSYYWRNNQMATTVLAYKILEREKNHEDYLAKITRFFLEQKRDGYWRNTVESASICAAILPGLLQRQPNFKSSPQVIIHTDEKRVIDKFPFTATIHSTATPIRFSKQGAGLTYITAWQKVFNTQPKAVTENFIIESGFEKDGKAIAALQAGEKAVMRVRVKVLKDAEYVLIEIPIPAGCTYAIKNQNWREHREFLKDKMIIFAEKLNKGEYAYSIELEPRYTGSYHLNPVRAELMYFATFYGRNEMKKVEIRQQAGMEE